MPSLHEYQHGPWRAVPVLGITQIVAWGAIYYSPVLMVPLIAAERGWSLAFGMAGFSLCLLTAGLIAPYVGGAIDRHGGHVVMTVGSLIAALGLAALPYAAHPLAYLAAWIVLGVGLAGSLYDAAFASIGRIFGAGARLPITALTLIGGFASTAGWPATHVLLGAFGWHATYLVFAGLMVAVCAPLHAFALPRVLAVAAPPAAGAPATVPSTVPPHGLVFVLVAAAFGAYAFVPAALSAHLLAIFGRSGIEPAHVIIIGALFGPAQVAARICELAFGRNLHPLNLARIALGVLVAGFVLLAFAGFSAPIAAAFALMFGAANGLVTIARGAVPLALFGPVGYGRVIGRLSAPWMVMQSVAPLVLAFVAERTSDPVALAVVACFALAALACFLAVRRPNR